MPILPRSRVSRIEPVAAPNETTIQMRTVLAKNIGMSLAALDKSDTMIRAGDNDVEKVPLRRRISRFLIITGWDYRIELLNCFLSVVACGMYVWETYDSRTYYSEMRLIEALCSAVFISDYFARLYLADQRFRHIFSSEAIVDLITISPVFFTNFDADVMFIRVLRVVRVVRVLRILRVSKFITSSIESEVSQEIASLILTLISAAFFAAGIIHQVDNMHREQYWLPLLDFHDSLYFVVVTFSTVGYGDIAPESDISKGIVLFLIIAGLVFIPKSTNNLVQLMSSDSVYARRRYKPSPAIKHVIVCGSVETEGIRAFLTELFHSDHGITDLHAVLFSEDDPDREMVTMLKDSKFSQSVTYLRGSPFLDKDLKRAGVHCATACFILNNQFCEYPDTEDAVSILRALSLKRYAKKSSGKELMTCLQLMRPGNMHHFTRKPVSADLNVDYTVVQQSLGGSKRTFGANVDLPTTVLKKVKLEKSVDPLICVDELKMNLLGQSCLCPGMVSLVTNLVLSLDEPKEDENASGLFPAWISEYNEGCEYEMYRTKLSPLFRTIPFNRACQLCYAQLGICVLALEISLMTESGNMMPEVILNPGDFEIPDVTKHEVHAFVIAKDKNSSDLSTLGYSSLQGFKNKQQQGRTRSASLIEFEGQRESLAEALADLHVDMPDLEKSFASARLSRGSTDRSDFKLSKHNSEKFTNYVTSALRGAFLRKEKSPRLPRSRVGSFKLSAYDSMDKASIGAMKLDENEPADSKRPGVVQTNKVSKKLANSAPVTPVPKRKIIFLGSKEELSRETSRDSKGFRSITRGINATLEEEAEDGANSDTGSVSSGAKNVKKKKFKSWLNRDGNLQKMKRQYATRADEDHNSCFTCQTPRLLDDATITAQYPEMSEHIVICGNIFNIGHLVRTLRAKHIGKVIPVVILHPTPPGAAMWKTVSSFPQVFYLQGSPLERDDLYRAGVKSASGAVVLGRASQEPGQQDSHMDAQSIFAHQGILEMNPNINCITEVMNHNNIEFLEMGVEVPPYYSLLAQSLDGFIYNKTIQFMAGSVYSSSMLNTLTCQSFFNPQITTVLKKLVSGNGEALTLGNSVQGRVYTQESLDMLAQMKDSNVYQVPVPQMFIGRRYELLFDELCLDEGVVPIALLRKGYLNDRARVRRYSNQAEAIAVAQNKNIRQQISTRLFAKRASSILPTKSVASPKAENKDSIDYTVTNPAPGTILLATDKVFILSLQAPGPKYSSTSKTDYLASMTQNARTLEKRHAKNNNNNNSSLNPPTPQYSSMEENMSKLLGEMQSMKETIAKLSSVSPQTSFSSLKPLGAASLGDEVAHF